MCAWKATPHFQALETKGLKADNFFPPQNQSVAATDQNMVVFRPPIVVTPSLFYSSSFLVGVLAATTLADNGPNSTALPPPPPSQPPDFSPFKPSVAVVVGVLTTVFAITFLLLLYTRHCKRRNGGAYGNSGGYGGGGATPSGRKNSGIDRTVIESLPVFRFGALTGHKEGLECAVCLAPFESTEVLRLLPKCKHAFHVECVDTWLDAHSTCPLCRYRVDPEDVLLIGDCNLWHENHPCCYQQEYPYSDPESITTCPDRSGCPRVSGRHSSAGERASLRTERSGSTPTVREPTSFRRSLDSSLAKKSGKELPMGRCSERPARKDGLLLLLAEGLQPDRKSLERRLEHRIVISTGESQRRPEDHRWSDLQPADLLYLRSEMILSESRRLCGGGGGYNGRSVSEITTVSRECGGANNARTHLRVHSRRGHQAGGAVSRWLAWVSSRPQAAAADVRSLCSPGSTSV